LCAEERLTQTFGQYGSITSVTMARNGRFAHISYAAPDGANAALGLNETDLDGKPATEWACGALSWIKSLTARDV